MQCTVSCAMQNQKVLFMDCDNTFSAKRLAQLAQDKFDAIAELIVLLKPLDFKEQTAVLDRIADYTEKNVGLIVIDAVTSLYAVKVAQSSGKAGFGVNRELNRQMAILAETAKISKIPAIVTSQVRSVFDDSTVSIAPVAKRVVKFWADNIINLQPTENMQVIKAVIEKPPHNQRENYCYVQIGENGITDA